jgi:hypothetical protein
MSSRSLDTEDVIQVIEILNELGGLIGRKISGACSLLQILLNADCTITERSKITHIFDIFKVC